MSLPYLYIKLLYKFGQDFLDIQRFYFTVSLVQWYLASHILLHIKPCLQRPWSSRRNVYITLCSRSLCPFYIASYYINLVKTSRTYSRSTLQFHWSSDTRRVIFYCILNRFTNALVFMAIISVLLYSFSSPVTLGESYSLTYQTDLQGDMYIAYITLCSKNLPILYSRLLYKIGQDFLDIHKFYLQFL